jgi:hypothetical protein
MHIWEDRNSRCPIDVTTTQPSDKQDETTHHCTNIGITVKSCINLKYGSWKEFISLIPI